MNIPNPFLMSPFIHFLIRHSLETVPTVALAVLLETHWICLLRPAYNASSTESSFVPQQVGRSVLVPTNEHAIVVVSGMETDEAKSQGRANSTYSLPAAVSRQEDNTKQAGTVSLAFYREQACLRNFSNRDNVLLEEEERGREFALGASYISLSAYAFAGLLLSFPEVGLFH